MTTKMFEIRDKATFIPVLAVKLHSEDEKENYLLRRAGYITESPDALPAVFLCRISTGGGESHSYSWLDRTMTTAHSFIQKNFNSLYTGDVVDVEFILGETKEPKQSERL